jgi:hypothetical protein
MRPLGGRTYAGVAKSLPLSIKRTFVRSAPLRVDRASVPPLVSQRGYGTRSDFELNFGQCLPSFGPVDATMGK